MAKRKSEKLVAPEGKRYVNRKMKVVGVIIRTPVRYVPDYELRDEAEAIELDKQWHPDWYGLDNKDVTPVPPSPEPPSNPPSMPSPEDFVGKVHDKLKGGQ